VYTKIRERENQVRLQSTQENTKKDTVDKTTSYGSPEWKVRVSHLILSRRKMRTPTAIIPPITH
jgi:hypothetical protein